MSAPEKREEIDFATLREHGRAVRDAAGELREATQQALADAEGMARSGIREHPYAVLGAAFAAGWVLAGGVPVKLATLATGVVGRAAIGVAAARLAELQRSGEGSAPQKRSGGGRPQASQQGSQEGI